MSLLGMLAAQASGDPLDASPGTLPYAHRTAAPWNAPTYAITPTPDGSGSAVHPDVVDFGPGNLWNGWRFWMGVTPYFNGDGAKENPLLLVSSDGFTWQTPTGAAPAYLFLPTSGRTGSDTDLVYDATGNRLILTWREYVLDPVGEWIYGSESTDGVTWAPKTLLWSVAGPTDAETASQALVRVGPNDWRAYARNKPSGTNGGLTVRTATNPLGTWSAPTQCVMPAVPSGGERFWHFDAIRIGSKFYGLFNFTGGTVTGVSTDGINWSRRATALLGARNGEWDDANMYRATMQPHVNGTHMRVWYSSDSTTVSWRVGYTKVPLTLWD